MKYEAPEINVIKLDVVDIILTSGENGNGGAGGSENEGPFTPFSLDNKF